MRKPKAACQAPAIYLLQSAICILLVLSSCRPSPRQSSPILHSALPSVELRVREARIFVEIVRRPEDRALGLMFRRSLAPDSGMLFIFDSQDMQRFWMKNTLLPLSIAYIDRQGVIADILEMAPLDTTTPYVSSKPALYALEMNSGWFLSRGVKPGDTVRGLPAR